tara:strand:+ start:1561 stop:2409 length:849 start_codon:yes stop_codon:yes gene_type:complete
MSTATLKAQVQLRIDALTAPTPAIEILQNAVDTVGLNLDLTNITSVLNSATTSITNLTTDDDITALNSASIALGVTSKASANNTKKLVMPSISIQELNLKLKSTFSNVFSSAVSSFWSEIDASHTTFGYESVSLSATSDTTEQTIVDVTGLGVLTHVIAPVLSGTGTMTIRVTIDGVVKTFISESLLIGSNSHRFCIGDFQNTEPTGSAGSGSGYGSEKDHGWSNSNQAFVTTPIQCLQRALIGMPFKTSLKVTIQGSVNITSTAENSKAAALYSLFIPEGL